MNRRMVLPTVAAAGLFSGLLALGAATTPSSQRLGFGYVLPSQATAAHAQLTATSGTAADPPRPSDLFGLGEPPSLPGTQSLPLTAAEIDQLLSTLGTSVVKDVKSSPPSGPVNGGSNCVVVVLNVNLFLAPVNFPNYGWQGTGSGAGVHNTQTGNGNGGYSATTNTTIPNAGCNQASKPATVSGTGGHEGGD